MTDLAHEDADRRGIWLPRWVIEATEGDYPTAVYFAQLLWWSQPGLDGRPRRAARFVERAGARWLAKPDHEWETETGLTANQARRARRRLVDAGLAAAANYKLDGHPVAHVRPLVTDSGSVPNRAPDSGSSANPWTRAAAPILGIGTRPETSTSSNEREPREEPTTRATVELFPVEPPADPQLVPQPVEPEPEGVDPFDEFWSTYPRRDDKGRARTAFASALRKTSVGAILDGARRYRDDPNRDPRYTKMPATWLNAEAWENAPLAARGDRPGSATAPTQQRTIGRIAL